MTTHNGTHIDALWHYASTTNGGERAWAIDEVPLGWCLRPGVKLDFRGKPDGHSVTAKEIEEELQRIGHSIAQLEIILMNASAGNGCQLRDWIGAGFG